MTKKELCLELSRSEGLLLSRAEKSADGVIRIIAASLARGESVSLRGLGRLEVKTRRERVGHDFSSGRRLYIPAGHRVCFKPCRALREELRDTRMDILL